MAMELPPMTSNIKEMYRYLVLLVEVMVVEQEVEEADTTEEMVELVLLLLQLVLMVLPELLPGVLGVGLLLEPMGLERPVLELMVKLSCITRS